MDRRRGDVDTRIGAGRDPFYGYAPRAKYAHATSDVWNSWSCDRFAWDFGNADASRLIDAGVAHFHHEGFADTHGHPGFDSGYCLGDPVATFVIRCNRS